MLANENEELANEFYVVLISSFVGFHTIKCGKQR